MVSRALPIKRIREVIDPKGLTTSEVIGKAGSPSISAKATIEGKRTVRE